MKKAKVGPGGESIYEPLDFFQVRAPLLPIEIRDELMSILELTSNSSETRLHSDRQSFFLSSLFSEHDIRRALAVASPALFDSMQRTRPGNPKAGKIRSSLLRYLLRMSTRPTPFGLFAGVGLGYWDDHTDLALAKMPYRVRTRPDMEWLMRLVLKLESKPEVRKHLNLHANPATVIRAGRVFLAERIATIQELSPAAVSLRATNVVRDTLRFAREPIPSQTLAAELLAKMPGASPGKIDRLLTQLLEQTILLTDLRPPLTVDSPAQYVLDRLVDIPEASEIRRGLQSVLEAAASWDLMSPESSAERYRELESVAREVEESEGTLFQVDMALPLGGNTISRAVAEEVSHAAEVLLRMSPLPQGLPHLAAFRRAFEARYGVDREVPVLELLDTNFGLGPPPAYGTGQYAAPVGVSQTNSFRRGQTLMELAISALRERNLEVAVDEQILKQLQTWPLSLANVPQSLEVYVSIGASSPTALDAGQFEVVIGPNVGSSSAGRSLGRFVDLLGTRAKEALTCAAEKEESCTPHKLWAELVYQPRQFKSANVSIRPNVRKYEIAFGVSRGRETTTIPLDELVVGVRSDRFYLRWPAAARDVVVTGSHMLNYLRAPAVCRFLAEISRDGCCQLGGFNWGPASAFPVLPRIRTGRIILSPARWRISANTRTTEFPTGQKPFAELLDRWRKNWQVPQHVYLTSGDNRLLLDLTDDGQADELKRAMGRLREGAAILLTEVLPNFDQTWVQDPEGRHFMSELVVSLVLRNGTGSAVPKDHTETHDDMCLRVDRPSEQMPVCQLATRMRSLGSDWLYAKLYGCRALEDQVIAGPIRSFAEQALRSGLADDWFFLRYADPENHIRLRFHGEPQRLIKELVPAISDWASDLFENELCLRFAVDTYEREIERYGGPAAMRAVEALFAADSRAVAEILNLLESNELTLDRISIAVLSLNDLLKSLQLGEAECSEWSRMHSSYRKESGAEYRERKRILRSLLSDANWLVRQPGGLEVGQVLALRGQRLAGIVEHLAELERDGKLVRSLAILCRSFVHLHLNRLLAADNATERQVLGLLWRTRKGLLHQTLA